MLELRNLTVGYPGHTVLNNVNLSFRKGEITTIIGKNGSGKSTLLKTACSLIKSQGGNITLDGREQRAYNRKEWAQKVAFLSQIHNDSNSTVLSLVTHGRYPHLGFSKRMGEDDYLLVDKAIRTLGIGDLQDKNLLEISGGERQKAYLAMALAQDTDYIAFDEPATYLDLAVQKDILKLLARLRDQGKCIIAVMHDLQAALQVSDCICLLDKGEITACGTPEELVSSSVIERVFGLDCTRVPKETGTLFLFS